MYMFITQYYYTGGCIKHETNGTLQTCSILRLYYTVNSGTDALVQPLQCSYGCVVNSVAIHRKLSVMG